MGYRIHIGSISKKKAERLSKMKTEKQVLKLCATDDDPDDAYVCGRELLDEPALLEFGKYVEWPNLIKDQFTAKTLLNYDTCKDFYSEHDFFAIDQAGFLEIIKYYDDQILKNYQDLYKIAFEPEKTPEDQKSDIFLYFRNKMQQWGGGRFVKGQRPYNLEGESICSSYRYEYMAFELARIYKTFDFENNYMVVHGW